MVIFPLAPDQTIAQMWSNGARGGGLLPLPHSVSYSLLSAWAWLERQDDVCNWSVCDDIVAQWYRRASAVIRYHRSEKPATISYVAMIQLGPYSQQTLLLLAKCMFTIPQWL